MLDVAIRFRLLKEVDEDYVETLLSEVDEVNKIGWIPEYRFLEERVVVGMGFIEEL